jgi:phenylalanyl-tRNA synthetase beta chain
MKFTLSWLKEHLDTDAPLGNLVDKLTMIGLEVEAVEDRAKALAPFTIARVISAEQHPNADRLRVCVVDAGTGAPVQVVCGAPNARAGMKGVFSPPGAFIPGKNMTLAVGTIRGVESRGMLCSAAELQISDDHEGATSARYTGDSCTPVRTHSSTTAGTAPSQNIMRQASSGGARLKARVLAIRMPA